MQMILGDSLVVLPTFAENSVDACVTDPPYHLVSIVKRFAKDSARNKATVGNGPYGRHAKGFMGKEWDGGDVAFRPETWAAVLRVLKPGAHLLAFGGTRTHHRIWCAIEDAGFEIRDTLMWVYGSGFPKSHNAGDGWGTALKPAFEPIILARKPLVGTIAENVMLWDTGAINIDGCRVQFADGDTTASAKSAGLGAGRGTYKGPALNKTVGGVISPPHDLGRWPANVLHDGSKEVIEAFPAAPGQIADASSSSESRKTQNVYGAMKRGSAEPSAERTYGEAWGMKPGARRLDSGSAARFFYCSKASKADRESGCADLPDKPGGQRSETSGQHITRRDGGDPGPVKNHHPTVKPFDLMRYLCRLVTPPGGVVLDPFTGSGSTGKAALAEGFDFIGIEREPEYHAIAERRILAEVDPFA